MCVRPILIMKAAPPINDGVGSPMRSLARLIRLWWEMNWCLFSHQQT